MIQKNENLLLLKSIIDVISINDGEEITLLNFYQKKNRIYDYFVICNGKSNKHVYSIYQNLKLNTNPKHVEGVEVIETSQWILIDYINIIVHIFLKEMRVYYNIDNIEPI
ncbi:ribosome silencing factor [Candidatus Karelsulcia muelleri]